MGCISWNISKDKPAIIDWGNGVKTRLTTPIYNNEQANNSTDFYAYYSEPGEYEISIDGWYNHFECSSLTTEKPGVTQIHKVLTEVIQVSSLITNFSRIFYNCSGLTNIPSGLFDSNTSVTDFGFTFYGCSSLTSIPVGLFDNNKSVTNFNGTFCLCSSLTSIPSNLFDKNISVTSFYKTFSNCKNLTGETPYTLSSDNKRIKLWDRNGKNGFVKPEDTNEAFGGCNNLTDFEAIPSGWK